MQTRNLTAQKTENDYEKKGCMRYTAVNVLHLHIRIPRTAKAAGNPLKISWQNLVEKGGGDQNFRTYIDLCPKYTRTLRESQANKIAEKPKSRLQ